MTALTDIPSSSSSFRPPTPKWTYDVFLSFRGGDTRKNFTDHLYTALKQKGLYTFRDDEELERGKAIAPKLWKAIEESRYVIVVLSRNYANSSWCLDEIAKIVDCMKVTEQTVLPVFYDVDPSNVRKQTGDHFGEAFSKHEEEFKEEPEKVRRWRRALFEVGSLSGWHLRDSHEASIIEEIARKISDDLSHIISSLSEGLVGMDSHLNKLLPYLEIGCPGVRIIGLWGMGGIGKTTIAQVVFERIQAQFEGCSFLGNVREVTEKQGAIHLQGKLLLNLLGISHVDNIQTTQMGRNTLRHRLCNKKVLIILDDVDQQEQLEDLCHPSWFGSGSRIIITSRDVQHLLKAFGVDNIYEVEALTDVEALQLFSSKAFKSSDHVGEDFLQLSQEFLKYANGLPLALKTLGSSVSGRNKELWSSSLDRLKENPDKRITAVLKVSFDGLLDDEKKIFLDIACFFIGEEKDRVTRILKCCGFFPDIGIAVLMEKSLLTLHGRLLRMHDLIQELGWEIIRQECSVEPGKRSRLWLRKDIIPVLTDRKGTSAVEGMFLNFTREDHVALSTNDPFINMDKLRLLKIWKVKFSGDIKYLSNELRFIEWHECPLRSLPSNFQADKLGELYLYSSLIEQLWTGEKSWSWLTIIDMSDSKYLRETPDFSKVPNLEKLVLQGCTRLVKVHKSIGVLKKLILLNMTDCNSFESLPPSISMESLQILILSACSRLKKFPEIEAGSMEKLARLYLDRTTIKELPSSIQYLTGLNLLNLSDCKNLLALPSSMQCLTSLKSLILSGCSQLHDIPENLSSMEYLEELDVSGTAVRKPTFIAGMKSLKRFSMKGCKEDEPASKPWHSLLNFWGRRGPAPMSLSLPSSFSGFPCLTELDLSDCNLSDGAIPDDLGSLLSLRTLCLSGNNFVSLPECISQLVKLLKLDLRNCSKFESLPKRLPASLVSVDADGCTSLRDFPNQFKIWTSPESMTLVSNLISTESNYQDDSVADIPKRKVIVWSPTRDSSMHHVSVHDQTSKLTDDFALPTQALQKSLEQTLKSSHAPAQYVLPENEIPEWFSRKNMNKFVNIQLTGDLKDDKNWMGVAVCAVFSADGTNEFEMEPKASDFFRLAVGTNCFKMKPEDMIVPKEHLEFLKSTAHFLYIVYLPGVQFPDKLNESSFMWAKFKSKIPGIKVEKCGIRLLYEQDSEGFVQTVMQLFDVDRKKPNIPSATWNIFRRSEEFQTWEENSVLLRQRNIKSVLRRYLERLKHEPKTYNFFLCRVPGWFRCQAGSSVKFDLPQDLHKSKRWMGYVMCALLKGNNGEENRLISTLKMEKCSIRLSCAVSETLDSHQLLIMYIPKDILPEKFVQLGARHSWMTLATLKIEGPYPAGIEVQMCGFRLLYQEHLEEFIGIITECILLSSDTMVEENDLVEDWLTMIRVPCHKQDHEVQRDNSREVAAAQRGRESEFIDDPHKREEFQEMSKYIRNRDWSVSHFSCPFPGIQVTKWFYVFKGGPASIPLPLNLYEDDKWLGVAVATHMSLHENPTIIRDTPDSEFLRDIRCLLHTDINLVRIMAVLRTKKAMWLHSCDFTWFFYIPRAQFSPTLNLCNVFQAKFISSTVGLGLHECGLRLVFEEDAEDLVQTLTQCILSHKCDGCEQEKQRADEYGALAERCI